MERQQQKNSGHSIAFRAAQSIRELWLEIEYILNFPPDQYVFAWPYEKEGKVDILKRKALSPPYPGHSPVSRNRVVRDNCYNQSDIKRDQSTLLNRQWFWQGCCSF